MVLVSGFGSGGSGGVGGLGIDFGLLTRASQAQVGVTGSLVDTHAAVAALFGDGLPRLIVAHRPPNDDHDQLAILTVEGAAVSAIEVAPRQGFIDQIATADLDGDGDLDIVTLHSDERGLSIVTQAGPLKFAEPVFYSPGAIVTRVVAGEFTGDEGVDLAVAHVVENSRRSAITMFVRGPDAAPGTIEYEAAVGGGCCETRCCVDGWSASDACRAGAYTSATKITCDMSLRTRARGGYYRA